MAIADAGVLARKDTDALVAEEGHGLQRAVGAFDLTALGVGAIIGTGIFVVIGEGIGKAGPAVVLWLALGMVVHLAYGRRHSRLRTGAGRRRVARE